MKKIYIIVFFYILLIDKAVAQDNYGQAFLDWVVNDLEEYSKSFTESNFELTWNNYFITRQEDLLDIISKSRRSILQAEKSINEIILKDSLGGLNLQATLASRILLYNHFVDMVKSKRFLNNLKKSSPFMELPDLTDFMKEGYYLNGSASILESFMRLNSNSIGIFNPSITLYYSPDGTYEGINGEFAPDSNYDDFQNALTIAASLVAYYKQAKITQSVAAAWVKYYANEILIAIAAIYLYLEYQEYREAKKQKEKFEQGIAALPSKIISPLQAYHLFQKTYETTKPKYDSLSRSIEKTLSSLDSAMTLTFTRLKNIDNRVNQRIQELVSEEDQLDQLLSNPRSNSDLIVLISKLDLLVNHEILLKEKFLECESRNCLLALDNYINQLRSNSITFTNILSDFPEGLLDQIYKNKVAFYEKEYAYLNEFIQLGKMNKRKINKLKSRILKHHTKSENNQITNNSLYSLLSLVADLGIKKPRFLGQQDDFNGWANFQVGSHDRFGLTLSMDFRLVLNGQGNYRQRFYNSYEMTDVMSSPFDGGFRKDLRNPRTNVGLMKINLNERIVSVNSALNEINELILQHQSKNKKTLDSLKFDFDKRFEEIKLNFESQEFETFDLNFKDELDSKVDQLEFEIDELSKFHNPENINPFYDSFNKVDFVSNHFDLESKIATEKGKLEALSNLDETDDLKINRAESLLRDAKHSTTVSKDLANLFLNEAINERLTLRYSPKKSLLPLLNDGIEYRNKLMSRYKDQAFEFYQCSDRTSDLTYTDCNRFAAQFLQNLFGINDFISDFGADSLTVFGQNKYRNTAQITEFIQNSNNWKMVETGIASVNHNLEFAQKLANIGYAVIAVKPPPNGHISIIMPGELKKTSWGMVPSVFDYRQSVSNKKRTRPLKRNFERALRNSFFGRPLSSAFSSKDRNKTLLFYYKNWRLELEDN